MSSKGPGWEPWSNQREKEEQRADYIEQETRHMGLNVKITQTDTSNDILCEVLRERYRQDSKWGQQDHTFAVWLMILSEEFGEVAKEANEYHFAKVKTVQDIVNKTLRGRNYREELIQVAAVAVAMVESYDRNEGTVREGEQDAD